MKIEVSKNKVMFNNGYSTQEIHPFWLRERVDGEEFLDKGTQQRLFDPSTMSSEVVIEKAIMGGKIEKFGPFNDIKLKGLASSDVKWNTAAENISVLMAALGMKPGGSPTQANPLAQYVEVEKPAYFNENKISKIYFFTIKFRVIVFNHVILWLCIIYNEIIAIFIIGYLYNF